MRLELAHLARDRVLVDREERVERVLKEGVQHRQLGEQEVDERASRRDPAVRLPRLVDGELGLPRGARLLGDRGRDARGRLEVLDQRDILEDVALGARELREDGLLQILDLEHVAVLLLDDVELALLEIGALFRGGQREQLVLEPVLRHRKVDERRLGLDLGREVRVGQLGLQVEPEAGVELELAVAQLDVQRAAVPSRAAREQG